LKAKIDHHDVARDLDAHRKEIQLMLEQEIVSAYYYQGGQLQIGLRTDKTIAEAERILNEKGVYQQIINSEEKSIDGDSSMKSGE
jgi:carboxyl-terminal processing protease